jgi:hypothetical protein
MADLWRDMRLCICFRVVDFLIFTVGFLLWFAIDAVLDVIFWQESLSEAAGMTTLFPTGFIVLFLPAMAAFQYCLEYLYVPYALLIFVIVMAWFKSDKDWPTISLFTFVSHSLAFLLFDHFRGDPSFGIEPLTHGFWIGWITVAVLTYVSALCVVRLSRRLSS